MSYNAPKRGLAAAALAKTEGAGLPPPREMLALYGHNEEAVQKMPDAQMWALFSKEFGGITYSTMRAIHDLDPDATPDWFREHRINKDRGAKMLATMTEEAGDAVGTPDPKRQKTT